VPKFTDGITENTPVILKTEAPGGELEIGDTGVVVAGWLKTKVCVKWGKDQKLRVIHRKRIAINFWEN
jgi:hypothetical protein